MKLKIKVKVLTPGCEPVVSPKADWVDLRAAEACTIRGPWAGYLNKGNKQRDVKFSNALVPLGVAIKLPKGIKGHLSVRSSTYKNFGVILANGEGKIDNSYSGNNDQWKANLIAFKDTKIEKGDRICQFEVQLSQKATFWQKLKWHLYNGIKIVYVDDLGGKDRGGFGSTGIK